MEYQSHPPGIDDNRIQTLRGMLADDSYEIDNCMIAEKVLEIEIALQLPAE